MAGGAGAGPGQWGGLAPPPRAPRAAPSGLAPAAPLPPAAGAAPPPAPPPPRPAPPPGCRLLPALLPPRPRRAPGSGQPRRARGTPHLHAGPHRQRPRPSGRQQPIATCGGQRGHGCVVVIPARDSRAGSGAPPDPGVRARPPPRDPGPAPARGPRRLGPCSPPHLWEGPPPRHKSSVRL